MTNEVKPKSKAIPKDRKESEAIEFVQNLKLFHMNWIAYLIVIPSLYVLNIVTSPDDIWVLWAAIPWLFAIGLHAMVFFGLFNIFGAEWEQRKFKERMNRPDY